MNYQSFIYWLINFSKPFSYLFCLFLFSLLFEVPSEGGNCGTHEDLELAFIIFPLAFRPVFWGVKPVATCVEYSRSSLPCVLQPLPSLPAQFHPASLNACTAGEWTNLMTKRSLPLVLSAFSCPAKPCKWSLPHVAAACGLQLLSGTVISGASGMSEDFSVGLTFLSEFCALRVWNLKPTSFVGFSLLISLSLKAWDTCLLERLHSIASIDL